MCVCVEVIKKMLKIGFVVRLCNKYGSLCLDCVHFVCFLFVCLLLLLLLVSVLFASVSRYVYALYKYSFTLNYETDSTDFADFHDGTAFSYITD